MNSYTEFHASLEGSIESFKIEDETRESMHCQHVHFSTSVQVCSSHGEDANCYERTCDNCNQIMLHVDDV